MGSQGIEAMMFCFTRIAMRSVGDVLCPAVLPRFSKREPRAHTEREHNTPFSIEPSRTNVASQHAPGTAFRDLQKAVSHIVTALPPK